MFGIDDAVSAVSNLASTVVTRVWPDATEVEKGKMELAIKEVQNEYNVILGQLKINEIEASSPHWFVAGARPAAMWVSVFTLFYSGVGISLLSYIGAFWGIPPLPLIDPVAQTNLLYGLLGLGTARTVEKLKGVETKKVGK